MKNSECNEQWIWSGMEKKSIKNKHSGLYRFLAPIKWFAHTIRTNFEHVKHTNCKCFRHSYVYCVMLCMCLCIIKTVSDTLNRHWLICQNAKYVNERRIDINANVGESTENCTVKNRYFATCDAAIAGVYILHSAFIRFLFSFFSPLFLFLLFSLAFSLFLYFFFQFYVRISKPQYGAV